MTKRKIDNLLFFTLLFLYSLGFYFKINLFILALGIIMFVIKIINSDYGITTIYDRIIGLVLFIFISLLLWYIRVKINISYASFPNTKRIQEFIFVALSVSNLLNHKFLSGNTKNNVR